MRGADIGGRLSKRERSNEEAKKAKAAIADSDASENLKGLHLGICPAMKHGNDCRRAAEGPNFLPVPSQLIVWLLLRRRCQLKR